MTDKPNIIEKLYNLENEEIAIDEREFRVCLEGVLKKYINTTIRKEFAFDLSWIECDVWICDKCVNFMEWVLNVTRRTGAYYDCIMEPPVIVLRPDFGPQLFFHEAIHHKQYIETYPLEKVFDKRQEARASKESHILNRKYSRELIKLIKSECGAVTYRRSKRKRR